METMRDDETEALRDKAVQIDEELRTMPREVLNVLDPVKLSGSDLMRFKCYPGISCFNSCCSHIEIILTPYDLLRLRKRLGLDAEEFLNRFAEPTFLAKGDLPVPLIRMDPESGKCPFVTDAGCSVYSDRPVACRYYPLGLALMHRQATPGDETFYFLVREPFCQGHAEAKSWTVDAWRADQGSDGYDEVNQEWMTFILKRRTAGDAAKTPLPMAEMVYMAQTDPDQMRRFVFGSTFRERFQVDAEEEKAILEDDVAMIRFAFRWLRSVMFGDREVTMRPQAMDILKKRRAGNPEG
ncbi:MAG: YkgJ family cysteine cluster protein [Magnetococcales bacterium]|nr:YkgJ family cysteine cluster protein [Magnetococcales bacterium]